MGAQVLLTSEMPRSSPDDERKVSSNDRDCAVLLTASAALHAVAKGSGPGFAWMRLGDVTFYSCYLSPNCSIAEFGERLGRLEASLRNVTHDTDIVVGGDFNAKSGDWGSALEDARGRMLVEWAADLRLVVSNVGDSPTFRRAGSESVIDVTFARLRDSSRVSDWRVLETFSDSDHQYIYYDLITGGQSRERAVESGRVSRENRPPGWCCRKLDPARLANFLDVRQPELPENVAAEEAAVLLSDYLTEACDASMPRRPAEAGGRRPVHWWSEDIARMRRACLASRRRYQRHRRRQRGEEEEGELREAFRAARKELCVAVRSAQEEGWRKLCAAVDNDPWGLPYKLVSKKLRRNPPGAEARGHEGAIADHLFPQLPTIDWSTEPRQRDEGGAHDPGEEAVLDGDPFSPAELLEAARRLPAGKASGPDGVPNEVLRRAVLAKPLLFLRVFNSCLQEQVFPAAWKRAKLVLLHKGPGKPVADPSSFRPLNAIGAVLETARAAARERDLCVVVSLDVRNAFNTAPWERIDAALGKKRIPGYLSGILRSYLSDRSLLVPTISEPRPVTCGVPQGSVLGPALWN
ncbi:Endonuclease/exonuclease/phosphatase,Reverse transcriptase domain, partial [Cinara cedri]